MEKKQDKKEAKVTKLKEHVAICDFPLRGKMFRKGDAVNVSAADFENLLKQKLVKVK